jgi:hypothetical protein
VSKAVMYINVQRWDNEFQIKKNYIFEIMYKEMGVYRRFSEEVAHTHFPWINDLDV